MEWRYFMYLISCATGKSLSPLKCWIKEENLQVSDVIAAMASESHEKWPFCTTGYRNSNTHIYKQQCCSRGVPTRDPFGLLGKHGFSKKCGPFSNWLTELLRFPPPCWWAPGHCPTAHRLTLPLAPTMDFIPGPSAHPDAKAHLITTATAIYTAKKLLLYLKSDLDP